MLRLSTNSASKNFAQKKFSLDTYKHFSVFQHRFGLFHTRDKTQFDQHLQFVPRALFHITTPIRNESKSNQQDEEESFGASFNRSRNKMKREKRREAQNKKRKRLTDVDARFEKERVGSIETDLSRLHLARALYRKEKVYDNVRVIPKKESHPLILDNAYDIAQQYKVIEGAPKTMNASRIIVIGKGREPKPILKPGTIPWKIFRSFTIEDMLDRDVDKMRWKLGELQFQRFEEHIIRIMEKKGDQITWGYWDKRFRTVKYLKRIHEIADREGLSPEQALTNLLTYFESSGKKRYAPLRSLELTYPTKIKADGTVGFNPSVYRLATNVLNPLNVFLLSSILLSHVAFITSSPWLAFPFLPITLHMVYSFFHGLYRAEQIKIFNEIVGYNYDNELLPSRWYRQPMFIIKSRFILSIVLLVGWRFFTSMVEDNGGLIPSIFHVLVLAAAFLNVVWIRRF